MYHLIIFDMNGTLTNTPFVDKASLAVLPGRKEKIKELQGQGITCAIATNQGGVAFGFATEEEATKEVADIAGQLGIRHWEISFAHPKPKWGYEQYASPAALALRKPEPGMLLNLMGDYGFTPDDTLMVGDRDEDQQAAEKAKCSFMWAKDFFADKGELILRIWDLFSQIDEIDPQGVQLSFFNRAGAGCIEGYNANCDWPLPEEAIAQLQKILEEEKKAANERVAAVVVGASSLDDFDPFLDADDLP